MSAIVFNSGRLHLFCMKCAYRLFLASFSLAAELICDEINLFDRKIDIPHGKTKLQTKNYTQVELLKRRNNFHKRKQTHVYITHTFKSLPQGKPHFIFANAANYQIFTQNNTTTASLIFH